MIDLSERVSQTKFAEIVGVTPQAVSERYRAGMLTPDAPCSQWLHEYCEQLRKEAAGRSGEMQQNLTMARIEESRENAAAKKQQRLRDAGDLLMLRDVQNLLIELPATVRTVVLQARDTIRDKLVSKYSMSLADEDVDEPIRAALRHIADRAGQLQETFGADTAGADTQAGTANC